MTMSARQNSLGIVRFGRPECVVAGLPVHGLAYTGVNHEGYLGEGGDHMPVGSAWTDIWGVTWRTEHEGVMGFPQVHPLPGPSALAGYRWPDPDDDRICSRIYEQRRAFAGGDVFLAGSHRSTLWETAYKIVGMDNLMVYFYTEPDFVREVLRRITDFQLGITRHYLACGIEVAGCGDDLGTQRGPLLGPKIVREFLMPEYRRLFDLLRAHNVLIEFHSCGCVEEVVGDLMELGVSVLNPVQATANNVDTVRRLTQGRMALAGGVSTSVIMEGPTERIALETRRAMWRLGRDGGYFCRPDQYMPFPPEHLRTLERTIEEYGQYPIADPDTQQS